MRSRTSARRARTGRLQRYCTRRDRAPQVTAIARPSAPGVNARSQTRRRGDGRPREKRGQRVGHQRGHRLPRPLPFRPALRRNAPRPRAPMTRYARIGRHLQRERIRHDVGEILSVRWTWLQKNRAGRRAPRRNPARSARCSGSRPSNAAPRRSHLTNATRSRWPYRSCRRRAVRLDRDAPVADRRPDPDARHGRVADARPPARTSRRCRRPAAAHCSSPGWRSGTRAPGHDGRRARRSRRGNSDGRAAPPPRRRGPRPPDAGCACSRRRSPCSGPVRSSRRDTRDPCRCARSSENVPDRSRPNRKFSPTQTSEARSQSSSTVSTNSSGSQRDRSRVKRTIATPWTPARSNASSFCSSVISRAGALSGRSTRGGCGSKIITDRRAAALTRLAADLSMSCWWPRCRPSKLPSATTGFTQCGRGLSGKYAICMGQETVERQAIVRKRHPGRQRADGDRVAQVVRDVREPGLPRADPRAPSRRPRRARNASGCGRWRSASSTSVSRPCEQRERRRRGCRCSR